MSIILAIRKVLILPLLIITLLTTPAAVSTESAELLSTDTFVFEQALMMGQGITNDGEYYYTSGSITAVNTQTLAKFDMDMNFVKANINPLPKVCKQRGNNHLGGISYYDGKIYAPVEGGDEVYACIVVFDADTLKATGEIYDLPNEDYGDGVPWCAVDPQTGYLYASIWDETKVIHVYDVNDGMKLVKDITLTGAQVKRIQGAEFYEGTLYLSKDNNHDGEIRQILKVDVDTGAVSVFAERNVGSEDIEAEGMTITKDENGPVFHVLDYNRAIGVFVHHYKLNAVA